MLRKVSCIALLFLSLTLLIFSFSIPENEYSWMLQADEPPTLVGADEALENFYMVFTLSVLSVATSLGALFLGRSRPPRIASASIIFLATLTLGSLFV